MSAGDARLNGDFVTDLKGLHCWADLDDDPSTFVTEDDRTTEYEVADATFLPVVDI
jgi:hypothetical protein